jgi:hypothetical protein
LNPIEKEEMKEIYFIEQTVGNSCAGISIIHLVSNLEEMKLIKDSPLSKYLEKTKDSTIQERTKELEFSKEIAICHKLASDPNAKINKINTKRVNYLIVKTESDEPSTFFHFISFIMKNDELYEMDSRRSTPLKRMKTSAKTFLFDVAEILKVYMSMSQNPYLFNMVAFARNLKE